MLDEKLVPKIGSTVGSAGARSVDCDRNASPSEISRHPFKAPWDDGLTAWTGPVAKLEVLDVVPVSGDERPSAVRTEGGSTLHIMDVTGVHVMESAPTGDGSGAPKGCRGRVGQIGHLEVRMECGEVERHIRTQRLHQPFTELGDFALGIIMARDEQSGDLKPNARLMMEILQRLKHRPRPSRIPRKSLGRCR